MFEAYSLTWGLLGIVVAVSIARCLKGWPPAHSTGWAALGGSVLGLVPAVAKLASNVWVPLGYAFWAIGIISVLLMGVTVEVAWVRTLQYASRTSRVKRAADPALAAVAYANRERRIIVLSFLAIWIMVAVALPLMHAILNY